MAEQDFGRLRVRDWVQERPERGSAEGVDLVSPCESGRVDGVSGELLVVAQETVCESAADDPGGDTDRCRPAEGRVGEHQCGEREVVVRISDDRCRPIDEGTSLAVDEEVERMQIAVADDPRRRRPGPVGRRH